MEDLKKLFSSPLFLAFGCISPIATYLISIQIVSEKDKNLAYIYATITLFIVAFIYYLYINWKKSIQIKELEKEISRIQDLLNQAKDSANNSDKKLKSALKFSKSSLRNIRRSCELMQMPLGNLNTNKTKNNTDDIRSIINKYEEIRIEVDNLEGNLDD
ncbi:hypothetical protein [Enterococcus sp.]|uniref:hypothetical protein n=1 Tax=Enterococcus sp. TaxID=35783 RepID=UPI002FCB2B90